MSDLLSLINLGIQSYLLRRYDSTRQTDRRVEHMTVPEVRYDWILQPGPGIEEVGEESVEGLSSVA